MSTGRKLFVPCGDHFPTTQRMLREHSPQQAVHRAKRGRTTTPTWPEKCNRTDKLEADVWSRNCWSPGAATVYIFIRQQFIAGLRKDSLREVRILPARLALCDLEAPGWGERRFPHCAFVASWLIDCCMAFSCFCLFALVFLCHTNPRGDTMLSSPDTFQMTMNWLADHRPCFFWVVSCLVFGFCVCWFCFAFALCFLFVFFWLVSCPRRWQLNGLCIDPSQFYFWCTLSILWCCYCINSLNLKYETSFPACLTTWRESFHIRHPGFSGGNRRHWWCNKVFKVEAFAGQIRKQMGTIVLRGNWPQQASEARDVNVEADDRRMISPAKCSIGLIWAKKIRYLGMTWRSQWSVFWCSSNRLQKKESHYQSISFMLEAAAAKMTEESSKFSNSEWRWKSHWLGGFYFPFSSIAKMATIFFYKFSYANAVTHLLQNENGTSLSLQLKTVLVCDCTCRSRCDGFQFAFTLFSRTAIGFWRSKNQLGSEE